jgi:hypothetical protein
LEERFAESARSARPESTGPSKATGQAPGKGGVPRRPP